MLDADKGVAVAFDWEPDFYKKRISDLLQIAMIIFVEALATLLIFAAMTGLGWCIHRLNPDRPLVSEVIRDIGDVGSAAYFLIFVIKDLWEYFKK